MDKDKWKTFPCKECLMRTSCTQRCFPWDSGYNLTRYVKAKYPHPVCLSCGTEFNSHWKVIAYTKCKYCRGDYDDI